MKIVKALWEHKARIAAHLYIALSLFMFTESTIGTLLISPIALIAYVAIAEELKGDTVIGVIVVQLPDIPSWQIEEVAEYIAEDVSRSGEVPVKLMVLSPEDVNDIREVLTSDD